MLIRSLHRCNSRQRNKFHGVIVIIVIPIRTRIESCCPSEPLGQYQEETNNMEPPDEDTSIFYEALIRRRIMSTWSQKSFLVIRHTSSSGLQLQTAPRVSQAENCRLTPTAGPYVSLILNEACASVYPSKNATLNQDLSDDSL